MAPHPQINFKLLYVFLAVAEHRSFRAAAETLNKSESAVSLQIRQLEDQVGLPLFHRTTRLVRLTREGATLHRAAQRSVAELDNGLSELRDAADLRSGILSIACVPTVAAARLPMALAAFQDRHPGVTIRLKELPGRELLECIRRFEVDVAIGPRLDDMADIQFEYVCADPICCLSARAYNLEATTTPEAIIQHPIILNSNSAVLRADLDRHFAACGLQLRPSFDVQHVHTMTAMAAAGLGVGLLPEIALPRDIPPGLVVSRIADPGIWRDLGIITNRGQALSPAAVRLCDAVRSALLREEEVR